jgi:hypothetical protein
MNINRRERAGGDRRVSALAVREIADAGRDPREISERRRPELPLERHHAPRVRVREPVSLHVIGVAPNDREHDRLEILGVHLPIAGHYSDNIGAERARSPVARRDGRADAPVLRVPHDHHPRAAALGRKDRRSIPARVVHHDNVVDEHGHRPDRLGDPALFVEGGHDYSDAGTLEHASS